MTKSRYISLILILGSLTALSPFSIDLYLPGFPAIAKDLATPVSKVALSLSSFFIGISAGQLIYGPLLDRFGRKIPLYFGLTIYLIASAGCAMAHSIEWLIALRFVQAIGSCAATVTPVALTRDLFPVSENAKVFSLLVLVLGASPLVAPTVGGYLVSFFGWHIVFVALAGLCAVLFIASVIWLPAGQPPDSTRSLKPVPIIRSFWSVFITPQFYTYTFVCATAFAGLFAYVSGSPILFMDHFGVSQKTYGWIFAALSVGFIGSSQLNNLLIRKFSSARILSVVIPFYLLLGVAFLTLSLLSPPDLPITLCFIFLLLSCVGMANPNATALALAPFDRNAGTASALLGAIQMGLGAGIAAFISLFEKPSVTPVAFSFCLSCVLAFAMLRIGGRKIVVPASTSGSAMASH